MKVKYIWITILALGLLTTLTQGGTTEAAVQAAAVGTAFTYQGRLTDASGPVSDNCDFQFSLWDVAGSGEPPTGGAQIGATQIRTDVEASEGLFVVQLDFGAGAFSGDARWLQIAVRCPAGSGDYTTLAPRQALTAAPYALYSSAAPWSGLTGVPSGFADGVDDDTTYSAGAGLTLNGAAFSVHFAGTGSAATVARSDHNHWGESWSGSGAGLILTSSDDNGIEITGGSGTGDAGVIVHSASGDGVHVGTVGGFGLHIDWAANGVVVEEAGGHAIRVDLAGGTGMYVREAGSPSTTGFSLANNGFQVDGAEGNGLFVGRADVTGVYVQSAGDDGVHVTSADDYGIYVAAAGLDGLRVESAGGHGVYANTSAANHEWGVYTPDKIYAGTTLVSGGALMLVAQNGDDRALETGDVVAVNGVGTPLAESDVPSPLVQKAGSANSAAVIGVVYRRFVVEKQVAGIGSERQTTFHTHSTPGPIAPGDYMLIVVLGPAQVKANASAGDIRPGDPLTVADNGYAAKAAQVEVSGVTFYPPGVTFGKAMESPDTAQSDGLIWAWVTLR